MVKFVQIYFLFAMIILCFGTCSTGEKGKQFNPTIVNEVDSQSFYAEELDSVKLDSLRMLELCFEFPTDIPRGSGAQVSPYWSKGLRFANNLSLGDATKLWSHPNHFMKTLAYSKIYQLDKSMAATCVIESSKDSTLVPRLYGASTLLEELVRISTRPIYPASSIKPSCTFDDSLRHRIVEATDKIYFQDNCYMKLSVAMDKD